VSPMQPRCVFYSLRKYIFMCYEFVKCILFYEFEPTI